MKIEWICGQEITYCKLNDGRLKVSYPGQNKREYYTISIAKLKRFIGDKNILKNCQLCSGLSAHKIFTVYALDTYDFLNKFNIDSYEIRAVKNKLRKILKSLGEI